MLDLALHVVEVEAALAEVKPTRRSVSKTPTQVRRVSSRRTKGRDDVRNGRDQDDAARLRGRQRARHGDVHRARRGGAVRARPSATRAPHPRAVGAGRLNAAPAVDVSGRPSGEARASNAWGISPDTSPRWPRCPHPTHEPLLRMRRPARGHTGDDRDIRRKLPVVDGVPRSRSQAAWDSAGVERWRVSRLTVTSPVATFATTGPGRSGPAERSFRPFCRSRPSVGWRAVPKHRA